MLLLLIVIVCLIAIPLAREFLVGIIGLLVIIGIVCVVGPLIIGFLPLILGILIPLGVVAYFHEKKKHQAKIEWLKNRGIEKVPNFMGDHEFWKDMENYNWVLLTEDGYVISASFHKMIVKQIDQIGFLTKNSFQNLCKKFAAAFEIMYLQPLLAYLIMQHQIFVLSVPDGEIYISLGVANRGRDLFALEGAATMTELADQCEVFMASNGYSGYGYVLAKSTIDQLLELDEVYKVDLPDQNEYLYVAKNQSANSKMVKKEISLDD